MKNYKYFIKLNVEGKLLIKTLKDWARENQNEFPKYSFEDNRSNIPITQEIEKHLIQEHNFKRIVEGNCVYLVRNEVSTNKILNEIETNKVSLLIQKYPNKLLTINSLDDIPTNEYLVYILFYENEPIVLGHGKKNRASVILDNINKITNSHLKALFVRLYVLFGSGNFKRFIILCSDKNESKTIEGELHKFIGGNNRNLPEFISLNLFKGINKDSMEAMILKIALNSSFSGIDDLKKWRREGILNDEVWSVISDKLKI